MKYVSQFVIIVAIGFVSEVLNSVIPAPVPACIYGICILFFLLLTGILKTENVREAARFLVDTQSVMFVPAGVGLMVIWSEVKDSLIKYILVCLVSCIIVMGVTGRITQAAINMSHKKKGAAHE